MLRSPATFYATEQKERLLDADTKLYPTLQLQSGPLSVRPALARENARKTNPRSLD
jgi:hypothetical protein